LRTDRQQQVTTNNNVPGHFLGLEIAVHFGYDAFGPMYSRD